MDGAADPGLGAVILVGGRSSRMGTDKADLEWDGVRAVDRVAELARLAGAGLVVTVGAKDHGWPSVGEEPAGGGPVAGLCAGAAWLSARGCERLLVLAVDAPTILPADLSPLLQAPSPGAAYAGLHLPLVVEARALPRGAAAGWAMGRLLDEARVRRLDPPAGAESRLRGANTPKERAVLLEALKNPAPRE